MYPKLYGGLRKGRRWLERQATAWKRARRGTFGWDRQGRNQRYWKRGRAWFGIRIRNLDCRTSSERGLRRWHKHLQPSYYQWQLSKPEQWLDTGYARDAENLRVPWCWKARDWETRCNQKCWNAFLARPSPKPYQAVRRPTGSPAIQCRRLGLIAVWRKRNLERRKRAYSEDRRIGSSQGRWRQWWNPRTKHGKCWQASKGHQYLGRQRVLQDKESHLPNHCESLDRTGEREMWAYSWAWNTTRDWSLELVIEVASASESP